jgi:hypothetical protein
MAKKRLELTREQIDLIEHVREQVKEAGDDEYAWGVIDALAFVWAGMPENAADSYAAGMSQFAELARKADL